MRKKVLTTMMTLIMAASALTGCGGSAAKVAPALSEVKKQATNLIDPGRPDLDSTEEVVVILQRGVHNMPDFDNAAFQEDFKDVCRNGKIHFIVPDGNPSCNFQSLPYERLDESQPAEKLNAALASRLDSLEKFSYTLAAKSEECDLIRSMLLAKQLLNASDSGLKKKIIICSNMINTTEPFKFTTKMIDNAQLSSIDILKNQKNIPDLTDVTVDVYYLGQVCDEQMELSETEKDNLEMIWAKYFEEAGTFANFHDDFPIAPKEGIIDREALPFVSAVETTADEDAFITGEPIVITEKEVEFKANEDNFKDPEKAEAALAKYAERINKYTGSILLLGTTAKPDGATEKGCKDLSLKRAYRVRETLIKKGVKEASKLICAGGGFSTPWYQNDHDSDGSFVESTAALNRSIILLSENSDDFKNMHELFGE